MRRHPPVIASAAKQSRRSAPRLPRTLRVLAMTGKRPGYDVNLYSWVYAIDFAAIGRCGSIVNTVTHSLRRGVST